MQSVSKVTTNFLPIVVTADVCLAIITHWKNYDWLGRFLAIVLLLNLEVALLLGFKKPREGERNRRVYRLPIVHYCWPPCCSIERKKKKFIF